MVSTTALLGVALLAPAWGMLRPGGASPFDARGLTPHSRTRLFTMGLMTNLLSPEIALMYAARAAKVAGHLHEHPRVMRTQRLVSGTVLGAFAAKMAVSHRPA